VGAVLADPPPRHMVASSSPNRPGRRRRSIPARALCSKAKLAQATAKANQTRLRNLKCFHCPPAGYPWDLMGPMAPAPYENL